MSSKGQIVIPKEIREAVNLQPDSHLLFEVDRKERTITISIAPDIKTLRAFFKVKSKYTDAEHEEAIAEGFVEDFLESERRSS